MTSLRRKILFYIFILAFIVITPNVVLYSAGYKIDLRHPFTPLMVQKTGMTIIQSEPAGAKIFLNDRAQKKSSLLFLKEENLVKTPAKIKDLLPGSYDLRVEADGYWPWNRRIKIYPGEITHVLDIKLFKKNLPSLITAAAFDQKTSLSPNKKKVFLPQDGLLIDLKTEISEKIASATPNNQNVSWSADSAKLMAGNKEISYTKTPIQSIDLEKMIGAGISNIKWSASKNDEIFYQYKNSVSRFNLASRANETLTGTEKILDYLAKEKEILYVMRDPDKPRLKIYSITDKKTTKEMGLPISEDYRFLNPENKLINLYDAQYRILYLIDPSPLSSAPLVETIKDVRNAEWITEQKLVYATDFEVWLLDLEKKDRRLLVRWSEPIKGIAKTKAENYLIYTTEKSINVVTWNINDEIQNTELIKMDKIGSPAFNENERTLYFMGQIGSQEGLYKLEI